MNSGMQPNIYVQRKTSKELHMWDSLNPFPRSKYYKYHGIRSKQSLIHNNHLDKKERIHCWGVIKVLHNWGSLNLFLQNKYSKSYDIDSKPSLINNTYLDKKLRMFCGA